MIGIQMPTSLISVWLQPFWECLSPLVTTADPPVRDLSYCIHEFLKDSHAWQNDQALWSYHRARMKAHLTLGWTDSSRLLNDMNRDYHKLRTRILHIPHTDWVPSTVQTYLAEMLEYLWVISGKQQISMHFMPKSATAKIRYIDDGLAVQFTMNLTDFATPDPLLWDLIFVDVSKRVSQSIAVSPESRDVG